MILADKIISLRKKAGWSQEQLAAELKVSRQSVSKWEGGLSIPDLDKVVKLSALFGVSTDYLLKDALETETPSETEAWDEPGPRMVDAETAGEYMTLVERVAPVMAAAASLLALSPIPVIFLGGVAECWGLLTEDMAGGLGVAILLAMGVVGVGLLVFNGMKLEPYEYLEKEPIVLGYGVEGIVNKRQAAFLPQFRVAITFGVGLSIASVIPLMLTTGVGSSDFTLVCMLCLLLGCVALAAFLFVRYGMLQGCYQKLLQQGDYSPAEKAHARRYGALAGVYWCTVTAIFLGYSLGWNAWGRSWIVWPVAGVLFAALSCLVRAFSQQDRR